jgi:hypothetical protein
MLIGLVAAGVIGQIDRKGVAPSLELRQRNADVRKAVEVTNGYFPILAELSGVRREHLWKVVLCVSVSRKG